MTTSRPNYPPTRSKLTAMKLTLNTAHANLPHVTMSADPDVKAALPDGPWQSEPDKMTWYDPTTDLACMIVRGPLGALCGYVAVDPSHPWHGVDYGSPIPGTEIDEDDWSARYDASPCAKVDVHGGLTYSAACHNNICHVPAPGRAHNVWWFGFDCGHAFDLIPDMLKLNKEIGWPSKALLNDDVYRDLDYVVAEVTDLAAQIAGVTR